MTASEHPIVVTGSASGLGAAVVDRLRAAGRTVIGIDLHDADIRADLSEPEGRQGAIDAVAERTDGVIGGLVANAGVAGLTETPGSLLASVNHFGTVAILEGLRPMLVAGGETAAVVVSSNSTTIQPDLPLEAVDVLLAGDEDEARRIADEIGPLAMYPISKLAVTRWVRRQAVTEDWAGAGVALNAVAPGPVETALLAATRKDPTVGSLVDSLPTPVGRIGRPDEVAALIEFLLGPDARFICGSVLFIDGGLDALLRADAQPAPWRT